MKINGGIEVATQPEKLWNLLQEPEFLKEIIPGCKEFNQVSEEKFEGKISMKVGAIASNYTAAFTIKDKLPPNSYNLELDGQGKGGFMRGKIHIELHAVEAGTMLKYDGEVNIGGTIARIGQRLLDAASKMLMKQGFKALKKKVESEA